MRSTKKLAMAALLALGLLALFAGPASAMKYSLNIAHPEGLSTGTMRAAGMGTDSAGNLYLGQGVVVEKFDSSGKYLTKFTTGVAGTVVKDVDVDSLGNVWAAAGGYLFKWNSSGTLLKKVTTETPNGLTVDSAGNVYSIGPYTVFKYDTNGNPAGAWLNVSFDGHGADIDADSTGIWTSGAAAKVIRRHDSAGKILNQWNVPTYQGGVAGDGAGNVWVAEGYSCRVRKYSSTGALLDSFGECATGTILVPGKFNSTYMPHERPGLAYGPGGVIWVSNGVEVQKWIP